MKIKDTGVAMILRCLQVACLTFTAIFITKGIGLADTVVFLHNSIIFDFSFLLGGSIILGYIIFSLIRYNETRMNMREPYAQHIRTRRTIAEIHNG